MVLQRAIREGGPPRQAEQQDFTGALLFADVTGFTRLTEHLARFPDGAERIDRHLNRYLGTVVEAIAAHGGDVFKFAGDALIAVWPCEPDEMDQASRAASACGLRIQRELASFVAEDDVALSMRICIAAGHLRFLQVGGILARWEPLLAGDPVTQLAQLKPVTTPGAVVLSPATAALLGPPFQTRSTPRAGSDTRNITLDLGNLALLDGKTEGGDKERPRRLLWVADLPEFPRLQRPELPEELASALRAWLPGALLSRLGQSHHEWLSELRQVTIVFAALPFEIGESLTIETAQPVVEALQRAVYRYDGGVDKISIDEKGAVLIGAFGLPPLAHEDDPARGCLAALAMHKAIVELGGKARIGVATGQVFCGPVGSTGRGEYTSLGAAVNLAARLMEASSDGPLCDHATMSLAKGTLAFTPLPPVQLKGVAEPVPVYLPGSVAARHVRPRSALVGRDTEREALSSALQAVVRVQLSATVVLIGEAGIGKSRLMEELYSQAEILKVRMLRGSGRSMDRNVAYHAWRAVFHDLFGLQPSDDKAQGAAKVEAMLARLPAEMRSLRPLIEPVLAMDLGDDDAARHLTGETRAQQTRAILCQLLNTAAASEPLCVVLEDVHWADSASWALIREVRLSVRPVLLVLASRPIDDAPAEFTELIQHNRPHNPSSARPSSVWTAADDDLIEVLHIHPLARAAVVELACQVLGAEDLPDDLAELIWERAGGNAYFVEELAHTLLDTGAVEVRDGVIDLRVSLAELAATRLPGSISGLIVSRLDTLSGVQQMTLKVASVLGRSFAVRAVQELLPIEESRHHVPAILPDLAVKDLVRHSEDDFHYLFKHALTQEAVYGLMLFAQRRNLHRAAAEWYERVFGSDLSHLLPVLAHHWERAEEWERAIGCLEQAAEANLERYANREAVDLLERALALTGKQPTGLPFKRIARWHRQLSEALFRIGELGRARTHGELGLRGVGVRVPGNLPMAIASLCGQLATRALQHWWPQRFRCTSPEDRQRRMEAIAVLNRLTETHIYAENAVGCLDSGLRELNLAEPMGPTAELGRAYAVMAVVLGAVPQLRAVARNWAERAVAAVDGREPAPVQSYVLTRVAIVDLYDAGWAAAETKFKRAVDVARITGDRRLREEALGVWGITLFFAGRFAESIPLIEMMASSANLSGNRQIQAWARLAQSAQLLRTGDLQEALHLLEEIEVWTTTSASNSEILWQRGLLALVWLRLGDAAKAQQVADSVQPLLAKRPVAYWLQNSLAALAEVYLALWQSAPPGSAEQRLLRGRAVAACRRVKRFGDAFAFGRPHGLLWQGSLQWQAGHANAARAAWLHCISEAERLAMPWEAALAKRDLGRHLPASDPQRAVLLAQAETALREFGATWDLEVTRHAQAGAP